MILQKPSEIYADSPTFRRCCRSPPHRCHELTGDRKGTLSLNLDGPFRLILRPAHEPLPLRPDGGLDWSAVTAVEIVGIEDTHG